MHVTVTPDTAHPDGSAALDPTAATAKTPEMPAVAASNPNA